MAGAVWSYKLLVSVWIDSWRGWVNIQDWNPIEIDRLEAFDLLEIISLGLFWDHFEYSFGPHLSELTPKQGPLIAPLEDCEFMAVDATV